MTASVAHPSIFAMPGKAFINSIEADVDVSMVGGKARALGRMIRSGVRVPPGFVLRTEALETHLCEAGIGDTLGLLCNEADFTKAEARASVSTAIRELICGAALPEVIRDELISRAHPLLARGPIVVRSSAVGEDSEAASFAGQLDSVLNVSDDESLERAVLSCWASYWSERALFYRRARGMHSAGMGVVVQSQVDAHAAGVMFTDDGSRALLVEYVDGLGDALVAGAVDPARIRVDRATGAIKHLGERIAEADAVVCTAAGVKSLLAAAAKVESEFGEAQDVEWAMTADGTLFIVQSRPITASLSMGRDSSPSPARQIVWSNANVNENFPAPISPLLYSVASAGYTHYFRNLGRAFGIAPRRLRAMEPAFAQIIGVHGGRMYYNLTNIHAVIRLAPFGDVLASGFDSFVGSQEESPASPVRPDASTTAQVGEVTLIAVKTAWQYLFLGRRIRRFERGADEFADRSHPDRLPGLSLAQLRELLAEFMEIRCHRWKDASLADTAAMVCYDALQRLIARAYPDKAGAAHTSLLKAIPGVVSNEPMHRLWELSRLIRNDEVLWRMIESKDATAVLDAIETEPQFAEFRTAFNQYLNDWGFRCSLELMLTAPTFQEEPAPLIAMLRAYARLDAESPVECMARQSDERELETARALTALGRLRIRLMPLITWATPLRVLLPWTHASIRYRERARLKQALLYSRLRRIALAIGDELVRREILSSRDDVFWLTVPELNELASGGAMFARTTRDLAALRADAHAKLSAMMPADSFTLAEAEYLDGSSTGEDTSVDVNAEGVLRGTAACTGCVTGRASVLKDVTEAERLTEGDVLVTRQTDPGWGPVFFLISGLVIERGGMLSHGAILAREFGIPCVVGVREATRVIPNGATVTVDADRERVHVAA
ncbi:MAG: PEP/pyruvate-binding domain-containing protein [Gemmatimonadaceae bacterium]